MEPDAARGRSRETRRRWAQLVAERADGHGPRILVVASFTAQPIEAGLGVGHFTSTGRRPTIGFAEYNQVFQVCLDPVHHGGDAADELVIIWRIEDLFERDLILAVEGDAAAEGRIVDGAGRLADAINSLAGSARGNLVVSDAPIPIGFGLDHHDDDVMIRLMALQSAVNRAVDARLPSTTTRLRLSTLQAVHGTVATFDRRTWLMYRQPLADWFATRVGFRIAEVIADRTRVPPKLLVLDCDNTLWGGVAAEDGIGRLECGDAFPGFAYRSFQLAVRRLRHQGVLLALASKNEDRTVVEVFGELDGMALRSADIAARRVNWEPKPINIAALANELNLGLDSFVFVDDSAYELGTVGAELPMVTCLRVPEDLEALPDLLSECGLFRRMRITADDRERTARIVTETARTEAASGMSHEEFLSSLDLRITLVAVTPSNLGRVAQLINKTNQFNLTTIRRSEADVARLASDPLAVLRGIEVEDAFGEYGLVGVAIARTSGGRAELETLLMSCRVFGRGVETAFLALITDMLRSSGIGDVIGRYVPTQKNALVADLFPRHGFVETGKPGVWVLPSGLQVPMPTHITALIG